jgi:hypothetical protein
MDDLEKRRALTEKAKQRTVDLREDTRPISEWVEIRPRFTKYGVRCRAPSISYIEDKPEYFETEPTSPTGLNAVYRPRAASLALSSSSFDSFDSKGHVRRHSGAHCSSLNVLQLSKSISLDTNDDNMNMKSPSRLSRRNSHDAGLRRSCDEALNGFKKNFNNTRNSNGKLNGSNGGSPRADFNSKTTSLHELCATNKLSLASLSIYASINPMDFRTTNEFRQLPLHICVDRDDPSSALVRELLKYYPQGAKIKDKNGNLPLFLACRRKKVNSGVIKALLQVYPDAASIKIMGALALHHLVHTGCPSPKAVLSLIEANPTAPSTPNSFGNVPLHFLCALREPHIPVVRILMSAFPEAVQLKNKYGETPIQRALAGCAVDTNPNAMNFTSRVKALSMRSSDSPIHGNSSVWGSTSSSASDSSSNGNNSGSGSDSESSLSNALDQELDDTDDPALRRERVRLLLRVSDRDALNEDQKQLLKQLNYEAHRMALLVFVSLCRKFSKFPVKHQHATNITEVSIGNTTTLTDSNVDHVHGIDPNDEQSKGISPEFRKAICAQDIWSNILSYI